MATSAARAALRSAPVDVTTLLAAAEQPVSVRLAPSVAGAIVGVIGTLLATLLVQAVVVPRVQARTRRRERWEADLNELDTLVTEQIGRAADRLRQAAASERHLQELLDAEDLKDLAPEQRDRIGQMQQQAGDERNTAREAVREHMERLTLLMGRIRRIQPRANHWRRLQFRALSTDSV
jgi:hypothetical protein